MTRDERDMLLVDVVVCRRLRSELDNRSWILRQHLARVIEDREKRLKEAADGPEKAAYG